METNTEFKAYIIIVGIFLAIVFGGKILWAEVIHDNWKCAFTECRILTK